MKSADVNSNFTALNNANNFSGTATSCNYASNMRINGGSQGASVNSSGIVTFNNPPHDQSGNHYSTYSRSSGFGGGTFSHGYNGTPNHIQPMVNSTNNAEGLGVDSLTGTTFHLNMPTSFTWLAYATNIF